jgi:hypothetical protein
LSALLDAKNVRDKMLEAQKKLKGQALKKKNKHSITTTSLSLSDAEDNDDDVVLLPDSECLNKAASTPKRVSCRLRNGVIPYCSAGGELFCTNSISRPVCLLMIPSSQVPIQRGSSITKAILHSCFELGNNLKETLCMQHIQTELPDKLLYCVQLRSKVVKVSSWVNKHPKNEHFKRLDSVFASTKSDGPNALKERDLDVATYFVLYNTDTNDIKSWMQSSWVSLVQSEYNVQDTMEVLKGMFFIN